MLERILNYCLFKIVFVGGIILDPLDYQQLIICTAWFSILGFLRIFILLVRDRLDFVISQFFPQLFFIFLIKFFGLFSC